MSGRMERPPLVVREDRIPQAAGHEAEQAGVLGEDAGLLLHGLGKRELVAGLGRRQRLRPLGFEPRGVEAVLAAVPFLLMHAHGWFDQLADGGGEQRADEGHVGEGGGANRIGTVVIVELLEVVGILEPAQGMKNGVVGPIVLWGALDGSPEEYILIVLLNPGSRA